MPVWAGLLRRFIADRRGSLLPITVGGIVVIGAIGAFALDLTYAYMARAELKGTADAVALAAIQELPVEGKMRATALQYARKNLPSVLFADADDEASPEIDSSSAARLRIDAGTWDVSARQFTVTTDAPNAVRATLMRTSGQGNPLMTVFGRLLGVNELSVSASTVVTRSTATCMYVLDPVEDKSLSLTGGSDIIMPDCGIDISSTDGRALEVSGGGHVESLETCIKGGFNLSGGSTAAPTPQTGCAAAGDPFASFSPPGHSGCDFVGRRVGGGSVTFTPGVYCGGIKMTGGVDATFQPGIYVIRDGELKSTGGGSLKGDGVAFYFTGNDARAEVSGGGDIILKAPRNGPLRGFVFYQGPFAEPDLKNKISGGGTIYYEGVVYFPDQHVEWSGGSIGTTPPWTIFVARTMLISGGGAFHSGADFASSDVPPPPGIQGGGVRLVN